MITCTEAVSRLWEYLDRALPPGDHESVETHLAFCRRCCGELEFAKELQRFLASKAGSGLPEDVHDRLEQFLASLTTERREP